MTFDAEVHAAVANSTLVKQRRMANWQSGTEERILLDLMELKFPAWTPSKRLRSLKRLVQKKRPIICPQNTRDGFERKPIGAATSRGAEEQAKYNAVTNPVHNPVNSQKRKDDNLAKRVAALRQFHAANPFANLGGLNAMILRSPEEFKGHICTKYMPTVFEKVFRELGVPARLAQQASKVMVEHWSPAYKRELFLEIEGLRKCVYTGMTQQVGERNTAMLQCCDVHCCCVAVLLCCSNTHTPTHADRRWSWSI